MFRILVVENDDDCRSSLVGLFESQGYEVDGAPSPEVAREILRSTLVHLAVVDMRLERNANPNDQTGLQLCKEMDSTVARIILTEFPDQAWRLVRESLQRDAAGGATADGFLAKKEGPRAILAVIRDTLRARYEIVPDQRIAVLTSGGDSPGMNAAIWAITRTAMARSVEVLGVRDGYRGLVEGDMEKLRWGDVAGIMNWSGTFLGSSRYEGFMRKDVRAKAVENLVRKHVSGLIVIGGDGSMKGAQALAGDMAEKGLRLNTVAIPGTIDNDLYGTDITLGSDSAANAMIAELRNMIAPAQALRRIFVVEVMGRHAGYLAQQAALGVGADAVLVAEDIIQTDVAGAIKLGAIERVFLDHIENAASGLERAFAAGKRHGFVILAEGLRLLADENYPEKAAHLLSNSVLQWNPAFRPDVRVQVLGYGVRGVPPTRQDIWLGAMLGREAVKALLDGQSEIMLGWKGCSLAPTGFNDVVANAHAGRPEWQELLKLQRELAAPLGPLPLDEAAAGTAAGCPK